MITVRLTEHQLSIVINAVEDSLDYDNMSKSDPYNTLRQRILLKLMKASAAEQIGEH